MSIQSILMRSNMADAKENPNKGHRQRVKERFLNDGNMDIYP